MIEIKPNLTSELASFVGKQPVARANAYSTSTYRELVQHVAKLAYYNRDHLLFFRGQDRDYRAKGGGSSFYPTIYRGEPLKSPELLLRFEILDSAVRQLKDAFRDQGLNGFKDVSRRQYVQWSILQHYGVCATPLLDFTHSIRVACSFAQASGHGHSAYVFVFGLPYVTNRISINSEHEIVNVRLLSICPPDALRPYFQDGYLAGTEDVTSDYESKTELDFRNRLLAKFEIPTTAGFWGRGFSGLPDSVLYPRGDRIAKLCSTMKPAPRSSPGSAEVGEFLAEWVDLEAALTGLARKTERIVPSVGRAIATLKKRQLISADLANELKSLRELRNQVVHRPRTTQPIQLAKATNRIRLVRSQLPW